ncbi:MAG TPA: metal ABC transporter substrate-binding protein [Acinetobacter sp.]|jgi:zinc transport system substrate-binding protein|uniref:metal ABC transporter substrate-binding protein n=1 Tax=Acinetobacter sp. AM TaxID=2170730 RepID=UPI000DE78FB0|nr:metal ABC transporter substrate-binding protein [Acinetobacter sp. AM]PWB13229.1 zinc ABC transporter substrate-binding protein [Acinetobacter sp. AM]HEX5380955.1 metal ABC transporter substrate-binding protein [Acinetobacter sp.]
MSRLFAFCLLSILSTVGWTQSLVVSTHPLYLIAQEVTKGVERPVLLLENQTGHDVSLTPAHRKAIQDAGLVIWLGKAHEAPLDKLLHNNPKAVSILSSGLVKTLPQRSTRGAPLANTVDTHVWLDPNNAVRIGFFIAALRSQQQPQYRDKYWHNAQAFAKQMFSTAQKFQSQGAARPYWAYHDAYQYLERPLHLKLAGSMTDDPHIAPTLAQIKYLNDHRGQKKMCLLAEAHASANQYQKLQPIVFQAVDESLTAENNFISAWSDLAQQVKNCVLTARQ